MGEATEAERRVLVEELIEAIASFPDHLQVTVAGTPPLNVTLAEVGMRQLQIGGVEGGTFPPMTRETMLDLAAA